MTNDKFTNIKKLESDGVDETWKKIKEAITSTMQAGLKSSVVARRRPWITDEILDCMDLRRTYKGVNNRMYLEAQKSIRRLIRTAKERWLSEECDDIERLDALHDSFGIHKRVKQAAGICRSGHTSCLSNKNGKLMSVEEQLVEWKSYVEALFRDE